MDLDAPVRADAEPASEREGSFSAASPAVPLPREESPVEEVMVQRRASVSVIPKLSTSASGTVLAEQTGKSLRERRHRSLSISVRPLTIDLSDSKSEPRMKAFESGLLSAPIKLQSETTQNLYELGEQLGQGTSARVFRARNTRTGGEVAIKRMFRRDDETVLVAQREFLLLRQLAHPGVIRAVDFGVDEYSAGWLAMEVFASETLTRTVKKHGRLSESAAVRVMCPLSSAVSYLHANGICHRDLKPDNVLVSISATDRRLSPRCDALKLIDFNVAVRVELSATCLSPVGLEPFVAPEVRREEEYGFPVDVWGMGAVAYYVLAAGFPCHGVKGGFATGGSNAAAPSPDDRPASARIAPELFREGVWSGSVSEELYAFLRRVLALDPVVRPTAQAVADAFESSFKCEDDHSGLPRGLVVIPESAPNSPSEIRTTPNESPPD
jgi:serine/threonine protein kinase